jgi:hypothetical protein
MVRLGSKAQRHNPGSEVVDSSTPQPELHDADVVDEPFAVAPPQPTLNLATRSVLVGDFHSADDG